ncbi:sodium/potassium-transporting ATPase subunit beta-1-interacting protein isoform X2 [Chironomus tepperi]|uniref:sodium/potassium-transporting ATPase subunit beta-1-interacting protein isoform X2 n=1 Tax=Chironomus tepperi TaxID=113505 RepID=UPI00391F8947
MCTRRSYLLFVCSLQLLTIIERQIFDFLGYMFAPILANFLHIIFVIFGLFGAYQFRGKYLSSYSVWNVLWIGWNTFIICFYLNISPLDRNSDLLNIGTGSVSWFETHGYGCKPVYLTNSTQEDPFRPIRPDRVDDCFLDYWMIEVIHSSIQIFLTLLGLIGAICIACVLWDDDDSLRRNNKQKRHSLYTVEFGAPVDAVRSGTLSHNRDDSLSPKAPMTPRRVKRRSVRGTSSRQSKRSDRGSNSGTNTHRSSTRSSRRKVHQNPVTKLMEQQNSFPSFKLTNSSNLTENNLKTLNNDYILNNQYQHQIPKKDMMPSKSAQALNSFQNQKQMNEHTAAMNRHTPTDPIYYNMNSSSPLLTQQTSWNEVSTPSPQGSNNYHHHHHHHHQHNHPLDAAVSLGHTNLTYVHSNPNLVDGEMNEYYQTERPPSARSSYSNFHGTRPLSYNANTVSNSKIRDSTKDNLFAGLSQQQQQQQVQHQSYSHSTRPHSLYHQPSQAIPQVPMKKNTGSRESLRFLNSAPPAYHQYNHTPPDSETTM